MSGPQKSRAPVAFSLDDPRLAGVPPGLKEKAAPPKKEAPVAKETPAAPKTEAPAGETPDVQAAAPARDTWGVPEMVSAGRNWGSIFLSAVGGLIVLAILLWIKTTFLTLLGRSDWIGWAATLLFATAVIAFAMIVSRELAGLYRLAEITATRKRANAALAAENTPEARLAAAEIRGMLAERRELADGISRLKQHDADIMEATQVLTLTERELLLPLDKTARVTVGTSGRRVSMVTALSPAAIFSVGFVAYENFRMLRNLAAIYGGRPGFISILKLMRLIAGHLALTGGMAFTDDILGQFVGHGMTSRLSKRLGEGLINGGFTIRIGIAAVEVLRPLPYIEARQPRLREFVSEFLKVGQNNGQQAERDRS